MGAGEGGGVDREKIIFFVLTRSSLLLSATTDAIKDLDPKRKCFRLIGGVLVERTVEEVLPAVQKNREGLSQVMEKLREQADQKTEKVDEMQKKYKIRVKGEPEPKDDEGEGDDSGKQGVLA